MAFWKRQNNGPVADDRERRPLAQIEAQLKIQDEFIAGRERDFAAAGAAESLIDGALAEARAFRDRLQQQLETLKTDIESGPQVAAARRDLLGQLWPDYCAELDHIEAAAIRLQEAHERARRLADQIRAAVDTTSNTGATHYPELGAAQALLALGAPQSRFSFESAVGRQNSTLQRFLWLLRQHRSAKVAA